jgi:FeoB-associated Cys-rich membrane protein
MTPTLQLVLVGAVIAAAVLYIARSAWKTWFGKSSKGCGAGCGKCATAPPEPKQEGRFPLPQV